MQNKDVKHITNLQKFLIAWFIFDWYAEDYKFLDPKIFWRYNQAFKHLVENWAWINPTLLKFISFEDITELEKLNSSEFVTNRDKYILELFDISVKNKIISSEDMFKEVDEIKKIRDKIEDVRVWWKTQSNSVKKILYSVQDMIEVNREKNW